MVVIPLLLSLYKKSKFEKPLLPYRDAMEITPLFLFSDKSSNVLLLPPDEGSFGNYTPEYQLSSRVAMSQLKEPRVMKVDMRSEY